MAGAAPFVTVTSKRYIVSTNADREFATEAARHLEALFDAFARIFGRGLGARRAKNLKANDAAYYAQAHAVIWYLMLAEKGRFQPKFCDFAKAAFQNRSREGLEEKSFRRPLADVAAEYEAWFRGAGWKK